MARRRLAFLAGLASDVRGSAKRARSRRRTARQPSTEQASSDEVKRRLDETRARLRNEIPPRED